MRGRTQDKGTNLETTTGAYCENDEQMGSLNHFIFKWESNSGSVHCKIIFLNHVS